jgi:long-chain fatty acid transport protein
MELTMNTNKILLPTLFLTLMPFQYALASMGNLATTYGLLPTDMATSQSYSLFNDQVSAAYYNPASLARDTKGQLTIGMLQATPELEVKTTGGNNPPVRSGSVLESDQTETVLFGMKTNITSLTKFNKPIYLALIGGVEKYGLEMLSFESGTSREGQFMQYGQKPLFLAVSMGGSAIDGVDVGFGMRVTLHANAEMLLETDLAGNTTNEKVNVSAEPVLIPLFGLSIDMEEVACEKKAKNSGGCLFEGLDLAISYRGESNTQTQVNANATIPGTVPSPGLPLIVNTLDAYQPMIISMGAKYQLNPSWDVAATLEYQNWSNLTSELKSDTIKDQANLKFEDTFIPRLGTRYQYNETLNLSAGFSYEASPLTSTESVDVNLFDNDRAVASLGLTKLYTDTNFLAFPLRIDAAYQYHLLMDRDFVLSELNEAQYETVTTSGSAHVLSLSFSMTF